VGGGKVGEGSFALQTVIDEFKTLSPDIINAVVFKLDSETLASSENTTLEQTQTLIESLNGITHSECIGGIESLTIQDTTARLSVASVGGVYLAVVSLRLADQKIIKSLTQVIAPTVIRLALGTVASPVKRIKRHLATQQPETKETVLLPEKELEIQQIPEPEVPAEPYQPKAPVTQFMVEKIGGLLVAADTVRIDIEVIEKWQNLCNGKQFTQVNVETLEGKTVICKFKPLKGAKTNAKGIIQIPNGILQTLGSGKGKLVMVKPVIQ